MPPRSAERRRKRTNPAERAVWVQRFRLSRQTQRAFAQDHDIGLSTLQNWLRRQGETAAAPRFVEVPVNVQPSNRDPWEAEIVLPNSTTVRLRGERAGEWASRILESAR
jgi:transposase-like protein